jgi:hypothetical protein
VIDYASKFKDLQADFQRIADRAPWARAVFTVEKDGRLGLFSVGRPEPEGQALLKGSRHGRDHAIGTELDSLTTQAGNVTLEAIRSKQFEWKPITEWPVTIYPTVPYACWLFFIASTPPVAFLCQGEEEGLCPFLFPRKKNPSAFWIDDYAQVCVSALTILRSGLRESSIAPPGVNGRRNSAVSRTPFEPLTTWNDVVATLRDEGGASSFKNDERTRSLIAAFNKKHGGPIKLPGRGGQPLVSKESLLQWWDNVREQIEKREEEKELKAESTRQSVSETHLYGATGKVAPSISGHIKQRKKAR